MASRDALPVVDTSEFTVEEVTGDYLTLSFTKPDEVEDVACLVQVSSELGAWEGEAVLADETSNGDGTTTYTYRDEVPLDSSGRRFMNLDVTRVE